MRPSRPKAGTASPPIEPPRVATWLVRPRFWVVLAQFVTLTLARVAPFMPIVQAAELIRAPMRKVTPANFSIKRESKTAMTPTVIAIGLYSVVMNLSDPLRMMVAISFIS